MRALTTFQLAALTLQAISAQYVQTYAGSDMKGSEDGFAMFATFNNPSDIVFDTNGNMFVVDTSNHKIRKITPHGMVSTFAGSGNPGSKDGTRLTADFFLPQSITIDKSDNLFVCDTYSHKIRKVTPAGVVSTVATGSDRSFILPQGIAIDETGNLFFTDTNSRIWRLSSNGTLGVFAGIGSAGAVDGLKMSASFNRPEGLAIDASGNMFVADTLNNRVRKISSSGIVSTFAGSIPGYADGTGINARFSSPHSIVIDKFGNLLVSDTENRRVRKISPSGVVTTIAGNGVSVPGNSDGYGSNATFGPLRGITLDSAGKLCFTENNYHCVRRIDFSPETKVEGQGQAAIKHEASNPDVSNVSTAETSYSTLVSVLQFSSCLATPTVYVSNVTQSSDSLSISSIVSISSVSVLIVMASAVAGYFYLRSVRRHKGELTTTWTNTTSATTIVDPALVYPSCGLVSFPAMNPSIQSQHCRLSQTLNQQANQGSSSREVSQGAEQISWDALGSR